MAKVSVCVPAYNNPDCVKRLLESLKEQDYQDYEVILTDDSTDGRIREYVEGLADKRILYVHNPKPLGHIFNWNKALSYAGGEYIKIMFSDDWFAHSSSLRLLVEMLDADPEASLAFCGSRQVLLKDPPEMLRERSAQETFLRGLKEDYRNLFLGNEIGAPSAVIYRRCGAAFDEKSNWASDMFLYFDILRHNPNFAHTKEALVCIGEHERQYTNLFSVYDKRKLEDYLYLYRKYDLKASVRCRLYLKDTFLVPYGVGAAQAEECGVPAKEYRKARREWLWRTRVVDYVKAGMRKLKLLKEKTYAV